MPLGSGAWQTALTDVRTLLSDGANDKLVWMKKVLGILNGTNTIFKTFEARRISPLVGSSGSPIGVFNNGVLVTTSAEDLESGQFTLAVAPVNGDTLVASYYYHWFDDTEIDQFLTTSSEWITGNDDYSSTPNGLWPAAKTYAAATGYQKLVSKMSINLAETFQLYDAPDQKRFDPVKVYGDMAEKMFKLAFELRDDVYKNRKGQALAPIARTMSGRVKDVMPNR